jgi:hypothetical protein
MNRQSRLLVLIAVTCLATAVVARGNVDESRPQATAPLTAFPEGTGREITERICRDCHPAGDVLRHRESRFRWSVIVGEMIGEGAKISDDDFEVIVSYLSVALGKKIKINEASAAAISEAFDISEEMAAAIVKQRTAKGGFKDWKDVASTPGVDAKRIEEQKGNLDFGSGS